MLKQSLKKTKRTDLAYFAGLVDGEAHIGLLKAKRTDRDGQDRYVPRLIISMLAKKQNIEVLESFKKTFGGSIYLRKPFEYKDRERITKKNQMALELRNLQAVDALEVLLPFLRIKKDHAKLVLTCTFRPRFRVSPEEVSRRKVVYETIKSLNDGRGKTL